VVKLRGWICFAHPEAGDDKQKQGLRHFFYSLQFAKMLDCLRPSSGGGIKTNQNRTPSNFFYPLDFAKTSFRSSRE
jgi:hypothetical protein